MDFDMEIDARGLNCPLPVLRLKKALAGLQGGQIVRVSTTDPNSAKDFEAFTRQTGHELLRQNEAPDKSFEFFVRHK
jgi:tRNA 2-thiouridine synthesizing protein A